MASVPGVGLIARFFGRTVSEGAAFAIGAATGPALRPLTQEITNTSWSAHPVRPPDAGTLASGVAQGQVDPGQAAVWAAQTGIGASQFKALVDIANTGPGVPAAFDLWRRGLIDEAGFRRAVKRQGIEPEWINDFIALKDVRLDPSVIANAVQQGHMPPGDILPPPVSGSPPFHIPLTQIDVDPHTEAAAWGIDDPRLRIMANLVGLPPGDHEMLEMWNRGIVDEASVDAGIREGHRKTKWIPAVKELRYAVLTAVQATNLRLRGWIKDPEMYALGAKTGYTPALMDLLFKEQGRPPSWHQIWIGLQRGGTYDGPLDVIDAAFLKGLQESNLRPEWYNLLWHSRYNYPSPFVLRQLTTSGAITLADAEQVLKFEGYEPTFAAKIATAWAGGPLAHVKAETAAQLKSEHEGWRLDPTQLAADLVTLGYPADVAQRLSLLTDDAVVHKYVGKAMDDVHKGFVGGAINADQAGVLLQGLRVGPDAISSLLEIWGLQKGL